MTPTITQHVLMRALAKRVALVIEDHQNFSGSGRHGPSKTTKAFNNFSTNVFFGSQYHPWNSRTLKNILDFTHDLSMTFHTWCDSMYMYQYDWIHPPSPIAANKETLQAGSLQALHRSFELQASLRGKLLLLATTSGANHDAAARDAAVFDRALPHSDSYFVIILFSIPDYARRTCDSIKARLETLCGGYHLLQWLPVFIDLFWCGALLVIAHCTYVWDKSWHQYVVPWV